MEDVKTIIEELESIRQFYGYGGLFLVIVLILGGIVIWKFAVKLTEKTAEEISEKTLKQFQSTLDKELVKFSTKHQKQIDAVQDCFQRFQELQAFVNYVVNGEKFTTPMTPDEEVKYLATYRLEFKRSYSRNRILFPESLNNKIESLLPELDIFIDDYIGGLMPIISDENIPEEYRNETQIAGIWPIGKLEPTLKKMDEINKGIEIEFRKIYGTDDK